MPIENPFDHNVECRYCDEQAAHAADCPWLEKLLAHVVDQEQVITNQLRTLGELRATLDATSQQLQQREFQVLTLCSLVGAEAEEHLESTIKQLFDAGAAARDFAAKIQFLVNWADAREMLADHTYTFPDGDTWESTLKKA
jgi:ferritin